LAAQFPSEAEYQENFAETHRNLGELLGDRGRSREAEAAFRQSLALFESLLTSSPNDPGRRLNLAISQWELADIVEADKPVEAEALYRAALDASTALLAEDPKNASYRQQLATVHNNLGLFFMQRGRLFEAETSVRRALPIYEELATEFPPYYRLNLCNVLGNLATILPNIGKANEAKPFELRASEIIDKLAADYPDIPEYQNRIGEKLINQGYKLMEEGKLEEAHNLLERAIAKQQNALKRDPDNPRYLRGLASARDNLGAVLDRMGHLDEAMTAFRSALEIEERITTKTPSVVREELRRTSFNLAQVLNRRRQFAEAEVLCRRSLEVCNRLVADAPSVPQHRMNLARTSDLLAVLCDDTNKLPEAEQAGRRAVEIQNALAADRPDDFEVRQMAGAYLSNLAQALVNAGKLTEASQLLEQAVIHQRAALKLKPGNAVSIEFLSTHLENLTELQIQLGDKEAAARTAEVFARHMNTFDSGHRDSENLLFRAIKNCEIMIQRPDGSYPQRRKFTLAARFLLVKAVIKDALQRAPNDPDQYMIADLLTTAPEPLRDPELALKLARRAVELKPGDEMCLQSLGWALYRTGDFRGSIETMKKVDGGPSSFIRAMAHWQLREKTEARAIFESGNEWLKGYEQLCEERLKQHTATYPPTSQQKRLQAEAAALLKSASAGPAQGSEAKPNPKP